MISVIIPTLNRAALLKKTLTSLTHQSMPAHDFEVLVVDNGSTDTTAQVVSEFTNHFNIKYLLETKPGLHEGRHRGMLESKSEILTFADDDIQALPTWLEGINESFNDAKVGLVGGKNIPEYESPPPAWLDSYWVSVPEGIFMTYFSLLDFGNETKVIDPLYVFGCNFSIRKSIVLNAKGFHPDGMPQSLIRYRGDGESYVAKHVSRMGYLTIYNPKASVEHWVPSSRMNLDYLVKRSFSEGISQSYIDTRNQNLDTDSTKSPYSPFSGLKKKVRELFLNSAERRIHNSFLDGYKYHQNELAHDKELMTWVTRETYINDELP